MCGKSFYSEHYLDQHMHNRHTDTQQYQADSVCLADYCDVMRCDLLMHAQLPTECDEDYMTELRIQCHSLVRECRPEKLEKNMTVEEFEDELQEAMCPYLTCERYFEHPGLRGYGHLVIIYFIVIMCIFGVVLLICYLAFDAVQEEQNSHRRYYVRVPEDDSDNDYNYSADYDYDSVTRSPFHQVQSLRSRIHAAGDDT
ncbi:PREDICTED: uncharacterized protein LOC106810980 [Priapulus caudatus]|uniref:Uncharacterized protein LOC106810980 n=1 Tax=Priapulus caudatus TaxID=37621 RepID=A0ABM1ECQ1_PRICU|nr:PREDICTED: uncharacterized protein LOC106810980 [Priapulus caudatus]